MSKTLIIAEKPSVAADIARSLGGFEKHQDYFENDQYVLSSAVGHLLELRAPEAYDVKRGKWTFTHLPVIPPHFDLAPIAKSEARLKVLMRLLKRKDVGQLINACDAGREGELIFRYIVQAAKARQPVRRLWLQSMTPAAIREAFGQLRSDDQMMPLADAARSRSEADWLVGINGTRAMTAFNSKEGGFYLTTVGRVQTPTLAIVVEREDKIRKFVSRDYWEVRAAFDAKAGRYEGRWFDPKFKKNDDVDARAERLWNGEKAAAIADACRGKTGTATEEAKPSTQLAPLLFDLTSLQREANSKFGFSAKTTLSIAQALYERHKVLTYPRTDSRALPEDYLATVRKTMDALGSTAPYREFAKKIVKQGWVKPNKRVFDNAKVSDHFAIIPTLQTPKQLSEVEAKLYDLVAKRFLSIFFPAAEYLVTTRITEVEGHSFKTEGKVLVEPGWLSIYGREAVEEQGSLPKIEQSERGEQVRATEVQSIALATRPPARLTEATLLSAMEGAGKLIEDDDLRAAMVGKGLGTPATRSTIIEGLIDQRYMVRDGKDLRPTRKAFDLITLLKGLDIPELTAPELTGEWEHKLSLMEHGQLKRDRFMKEIAGMTKKVVDRAKSYQSNTVPIDDPATLATPCPNCKGKIVENYRRYACTKCEFSLPKHPGSRTFEVEEVEQLLRDRTIGPLNGFISKMGRPFAAVLKITPELKIEFDFGQSNEGDGEPIDFSQITPIGPCPKCDGRVFEQPMSYLCENSVGPEKRCDFRSGKVILQQPIAPAQMVKLLVEGRTDVMRGFVSNRTRRKFSAFLVKKPDGSTGFEFEPRPVKTGAAAKRAGKAINGDAVAVDAASKPTKTRAKAVVAISDVAPAAKTSMPARKTSRITARKTAVKSARGASVRKPAARG